MKRICSSRGLYETRFRYASSAQLLSKRNYGIRFLVYFCRRGTENSRQVAENSKAVRIARTRYFRSYDLSSFAERAQLGEKHRWSYSTETLTLTRVTLRWIDHYKFCRSSKKWKNRKFKEVNLKNESAHNAWSYSRNTISRSIWRNVWVTGRSMKMGLSLCEWIEINDANSKFQNMWFNSTLKKFLIWWILCTHP